ncbi:MAG: 16S rRNA (cytosine(967)-C(5))-methyltransferase RsmB, partial [Clostridiaceae bacterium]
GLKNVEISKWDATLINNEFINKADRVLLDVPCSGLGIIRKKPEIKWNKNINEISSLINIQRKILSNGSKYLKPGGILVYSTCTLNKKENEDNINWFLEKNNDYEAVKIDLPSFHNFNKTSEGYLTIFPDEFMDGFFMAKLKKRTSLR